MVRVLPGTSMRTLLREIQSKSVVRLGTLPRWGIYVDEDEEVE